MRRVVVTGLGMLSPFGIGVKNAWEQILQSKSGIRKIKGFDTSEFGVQIAGEIPLGEGKNELNMDTFIPPKEQRHIDKFIQYALVAAEEAIKDSKLDLNKENLEDIGVMVGSGIGGIETIYNCSIELKEKGPKRVSPFFIPASLINLASGHISIKYGFRGPNHSVVTACSTGSHAIADAARLIKGGETEIMIAGGAEAAVNPIGMVGFIQAKALTSKFNEEPAKGSRPWDANRSGFVMGEGSGILVLEEYEHAKKRGATIYGEIKGYGLSGDAYHITAPHSEGLGAMLAMKRALKSAEITAEEIGYINAHGTSTPSGDLAEVKAVKSLFNSHAYKLAMSSTKSSTGHLLGAAGAVEAIFSLLALKEGVLPPTINLDEPGEGCDLNFVPHKPQENSIKYAMSNSFGFGGTNSSLILGKV